MFPFSTGEGQGIKYFLVPQGMNWTDFWRDKKGSQTLKVSQVKINEAHGETVPRQPFWKYGMVN